MHRSSTFSPTRGLFPLGLAFAALLAVSVAAQGEPVGDWASYLGGSANDAARCVAVAPDGGLVVGGWAGSGDFPTTPGVYREVGGGDAFIAKLSPDGRELLWSTYLGGSGIEEVTDLEVAEDGSIVVCGWTSSRDFPITPGVYQWWFGGAGLVAGLGDAFVARISADGRELLWSTFLGGGGDDFAWEIHLSPNGDVTVAGETDSEHFPITPGVLQEQLGSVSLWLSDSFVARMRLEDGAMQWVTYYGGGQHELLGGMDVDANGRVLIGGLTASNDLPQPDGGPGREIDGTVDAYMAVISADGARVEIARQFGSPGSDEIKDVAFGPAGELWAVGLIADQDEDVPATFEVTTDAWQRLSSGDAEGFVLSFSADGERLRASTLIGGSSDDRCESITLLPDGDLLVAGVTESEDFPLAGQVEWQSYAGGIGDVFVARFDERVRQASAIGLFGGSLKDAAYDLVGIGDGGFAVAGGSFSTDLPGTLNAAQAAPAGDSDAFVLRGDRQPKGETDLGVRPGEVAPATAFEPGSSLLGFDLLLRNHSAKTVLVDAVEFLLGGDFDPSRDLGGLRLLLDLDRDGEVDPGEPQLGGTSRVDSVGGALRFEFEARSLEPDEELGLLVLIDSQTACRDEVEFVLALLSGGAIEARDALTGRRVSDDLATRAQGTSWYCGVRRRYSADLDFDGVATCRDLRRMAKQIGRFSDDPELDPNRDGRITDEDLELAVNRVLGRPPAWVPEIEVPVGGPLPLLGYDLPEDLAARIGDEVLKTWIRDHNSAVFRAPEQYGGGPVELVLFRSDGVELGRYQIRLR